MHRLFRFAVKCFPVDTIIASLFATVVGVVTVQMTERGRVHVERKVSFHYDVIITSLTECFYRQNALYLALRKFLPVVTLVIRLSFVKFVV